jgi:CBS domain-containing protein
MGDVMNGKEPLKSLFVFDMKNKTIDANAKISQAIDQMKDGSKHCLLVKLRSDKAVGIVSEHDIVVACARLGKGAKDAPVKDYMTTDVVVAKETDTLDEALRLMAANNVRHLPVLSQKGEVVDFLSMMDLVMKKLNV